MKKLLLVALAAVTMASCAKTEVVEINQGNEISFSAWTANPGRVAPTTTATITDFAVWAYTTAATPDLYFDAQEVSNTSGSWDYTPHKFWPSDNLNFYSVSPAFLNTSVTDASDKVTVSFAADTDVAQQDDLLYAVNLNEARKNTPVQVAFDHALSLVSFKAKNGNAALEVVVSGVEVVNVNSVGTFTLPITANTVGDDDAATALQSNWVSETPASYAAAMETANLTLNGSAVELTEDAAGRLLLIPQATTAWVTTDTTNTAGGSYFLVNCTVKDVLSNLYLWGAAGTPKQLAVPFAADWYPGKHYVYTFVFGEGAGYVPPTDGTSPGKEVIVPISFDVVVDDFTAATTLPDTNM